MSRPPRPAAPLVLVLLLQGAAVLPRLALGGNGNDYKKFVKPPATWKALNPPSCAVGFADIAKHLTTWATQIVAETTLCATERGWGGMTLSGSNGELSFGSAEMWPFHNQLGCAANLVGNFGSISSICADALNMAFVCWSDNQACGQAISNVITQFTDASTSLIHASAFCTRPGQDAPYFSNHDVATNGIQCWQVCWNVLFKMVSAAKNIDVAISNCDTGAADSAAEPETEPEPEPVKEGDAEPAAEPAADSAAEPAPEPLGSDGSAASSWSDLAQPEPFKTLANGLPPAGASERRLASSAAAPAGPAAAAAAVPSAAAVAAPSGGPRLSAAPPTQASSFGKDLDEAASSLLVIRSILERAASASEASEPPPVMV